MKRVIHISEVSLSNIPKPIAVVRTNPVKYIEAPLTYVYKQGEKTVEDRFFVQTDKLVTARPFTLDPPARPAFAAAREESSSTSPSPEQMKRNLCVELSTPAGEAVERTYAMLLDFLVDWVLQVAPKGDLGTGMKGLKTRDGAEAVISKCVFYREGKPPLKFFDLKSPFNDRSKILTIFKVPTGRVVGPHLLVGRLFEFIGVIHFRRIYVGSKVSLQSSLDTVILSMILESPTSVLEEKTMRQLREENPEALNSLMTALDFAGERGAMTSRTGTEPHDAQNGDLDEIERVMVAEKERREREEAAAAVSTPLETTASSDRKRKIILGSKKFTTDV